MPVKRKIEWFFRKLVGLLSIVRGYNLLVIIVAQYLTSIFILSEEASFITVVTELRLLTLIISTALVIASGYIINSFYDREKDLINRPQKTKLDKLVSQRTKLSIYFILNFLAVIVASYNSFNAVLFFSFYIFGIWLYSHKLKRLVIVGNIVATLLAIFPFFAIFMYYKNYDWVIFGHAHFLTLLILIREIVKDLENISGDIAAGYRTMPIVFGEQKTKHTLTFLVLVTLFVVWLLILFFSLGHMDYYFMFSVLVLLFFLWLVVKSKNKKDYLLLHNILKFLIVAGVLSIVLIDPKVLAS